MRALKLVIFLGLFTTLTSVKTMEDGFKNLAIKEKFTKLLLQPSIEHPDGTVWDFDRIKRADSFLAKYLEENEYKDVHSLGMMMLAPQSLLAVLLATSKQKNDSCIYVLMESWSAFAGAQVKLFSHGSLVSPFKIMRLKVAQVQSQNQLALTLYVKDESNISKDLILFENLAANFMKIVGQKTLKTWELKK